jgi:hypothetical protein
MIEIEGAKRSKQMPPYNRIPKVVLDAMAHRFQVGEENYGKDNWKNGGPKFFDDTQNHLVGHLWNFFEGDVGDEETLIAQLEAVLWNAGATLWWVKEGKQKWEQKHNETAVHTRQSARKGKI